MGHIIWSILYDRNKIEPGKVICKRANSQNEFFLLGMYSSSEGCSTFPKPAIFQETASFDDWIQETIQKEKKCLCHKVSTFIEF